MAITTLNDLANVKNTFEVELPPFADGTPFTAELRKPSLINMICSGRVSNPLILDALKLIGENSGKDELSKEEAFKAQIESMKFMKGIAEYCLVVPKMEDIVKTVGDLTDEQIIAIFNFAQFDVNKLSKFCEVPANS